MKTKMFILAVLLLAAGAGVHAQYSADYYHRTGDTIYTRSEIGFYNWWDFERMDSLREPMYYSAGSILRYRPLVITPYYTTTPLKVVGVAGCIWDASMSSNPAWRPEYVYLFDNGNNHPVFKRRAEVRYLDEHAHRYLHLNISTHLSYTYPTDSCCRVSPQPHVIKLYESYFDTAVTVTDTFYVGWSHNNYTKSGIQVEYNYVRADLGMSSDIGQCSELDTFYSQWPIESICFFPWIDYYYCTDTGIIENPGGNFEWTYYPQRHFELLYPLIEIDTTVPPAFLCEPVQNLQATVLDTGSGCVFFSWDDFLHYTYCELQYYAPRNGIASTVDTIVSGANILHLCGLDTMLAYYVRARAFCDTSKIETDWSNWVPFSFPHTDPPSPPEPPQGIAEPSVLDRFTHLLPNPASDRVTVMSELGLHRIEVYNARGILVYSEPVGYSQATIDLRGWPAGQYMMSIETRRGKTTKRLVVAR